VPRFRLLHCSDLHLAVNEQQVGFPELLPALRAGEPVFPGTVSTYNRHRLDAMVSFAFVHRDRYDAVVISGDLASTGDLGDLDRVATLLDAPVHQDYVDRDGRPTLQATGRPVILIPGNHDRFGAPPLHSPGNAKFDHVLFKYWTGGQTAKRLWSIERGDAGLTLLGADLTLHNDEIGDGPWGYLGQGRAYSSVIDKLSALTRAEREAAPRTIVLWVIHFDPTIDYPRSLVLLDGELLANAVSRERVPAILCGHTHVNGVRRFAGSTVYNCGTTTQAFAPHGNFLSFIELDWPPGAAAPTVAAVPFRFDRGRKVFVGDK
jgi:3',5'-cyclic AMP phosphodiesterase CpdA